MLAKLSLAFSNAFEVITAPEAWSSLALIIAVAAILSVSMPSADRPAREMGGRRRTRFLALFKGGTTIIYYERSDARSE